MKRTIIAILALTFICAALGLAQATRPADLTYPPLKYQDLRRHRAFHLAW